MSCFGEAGAYYRRNGQPGTPVSEDSQGSAKGKDTTEATHQPSGPHALLVTVSIKWMDSPLATPQPRRPSPGWPWEKQMVPEWQS